eukprot:507962_1
MAFDRQRLRSQLPSAKLDLSPVQIADILCYIFQFTNPLELSSSISLVSQYWNRLVFSNKLLWCYYCDLLWKGKFFITPKAIHIKHSKPLDAFKMSYIDRERNVITLKELTAIKWQFKLKQHPLYENATVFFAQFNIDGTLTHQNIHFMGRQFKWKFVEQITTNVFGLQRSSRFNRLDDFDVKAKSATNSNTPTRYGYERYMKQRSNTLDIGDHATEDGEREEGEVSRLSMYRTNKYEQKELTQSRWVRINNFPPLCAFRNRDWGWILQNEHIIFTSCEW